MDTTCLTLVVFFLGHNYIGSEHLLLGLLREGEGVAARVLENLGADPSNIRTQASIIIVLNGLFVYLLSCDPQGAGWK